MSSDVGSFPLPVGAPAPAGGAGNVGHGHVFPRPDGRVARCGGPGICRECSRDAGLRATQTGGHTVTFDLDDTGLTVTAECHAGVNAPCQGPEGCQATKDFALPFTGVAAPRLVDGVWVW
jgi:hypothetical protein